MKYTICSFGKKNSPRLEKSVSPLLSSHPPRPPTPKSELEVAFTRSWVILDFAVDQIVIKMNFSVGVIALKH